MNKPEWGAKIVSFDEFDKLRPKLGKVVATSGGFDPIHPGISAVLSRVRNTAIRWS